MNNSREQGAKEDQEREVREIRNALQNHRVVVLDVYIDEKSYGDVRLRLLQLQIEGAGPVRLLIDCNGGERFYAEKLYGLINGILTMPVHALVVGKCASAATRILLACKVRRSMPYGQFLIHSGSMENISLKQDGMTEKNVDRLLREIRKDTEKLITFYQRHLKKSRRIIKKLIEGGDEKFDNYLSAQEALEIGLITEIVSGNAEIFPPFPKER